jgi:hypothetical protein
MNNKNIFDNIGLESSTNSMTPLQVSQLGQLLPDQDTIRVLEFGAGQTTIRLFNALKTKYSNVTYVTYETNKTYAPNLDGIQVRMHTKKDLATLSISIPTDEVYDIVIVDGPDGELRQHWYSIFKPNTQSGTIIHIDDAFHYESFEAEFRKNFPNVVDLFVVPLGQGGGNKCWITAKVI